ncbi:MAG TPA: bifunctional riboflavin kinase/FAD synthetase [Desulfuromonadales bacterium]|nr:bifunctional riboflavin kinase/FAD synthetase [Desulfuromonadales bacterium]
MHIISGTNVYDKILAASIVTIGNFDGVHRGHAEIFAHLKQTSTSRGIPSVVVTFEPHPLKILAPESAPAMITTFEQKASLIEKSGIDYLVVVPFTKEFSRLSARDFVISVLCSPLGMQHIIIGHDYAFGRGREGNFSTLQRLGELNGFTLEDLPPIGEEGVIFSSSLVRSAISRGDIEAAARVLGRYYPICGTVEHGREIGRSLGFPTANIHTANELLPADGVYAVKVEVHGQYSNGACSIGCNPTFAGNVRTVEVFLLDFSGQIYDQPVQVHFVQRLRSVRKFSDGQALKAQIELDVAAARSILESLDVKFKTYNGVPE